MAGLEPVAMKPIFRYLWFFTRWLFGRVDQIDWDIVKIANNNDRLHRLVLDHAWGTAKGEYALGRPLPVERDLLRRGWAKVKRQEAYLAKLRETRDVVQAMAVLEQVKENK